MVEVVMPKLGLTMKEGKIVEWRVKTGDQVKKGNILFVLETEKITYEVEAGHDGTLGKTLVQEGQTVPVGTVVAYILEAGESQEQIPGAVKVLVPENEKTIARAAIIGDSVEQADSSFKEEYRIKISPVAKRLAEEYGVRIETIRGTGPGGRIVKEDVLGAVQKEDSTGKKSLKEEVEIIKHSSMRQTIARRMSESFYSAPHVFFTMEVNAEEAIMLRKELLPHLEKKTGCRLTFTDIVIKITAQVIREFPKINSCWSEEGIKVFNSVNIGVATAVQDGLLVPVIRNAHLKTLAEICSDRDDLIRRAKEGKISMDEMAGGTFTITNLGMYDMDFFTAIINPPESAILALGSAKDRPFVIDKEVKIKPIMHLTLSVDHRMIDGAYAAQFLRQLKEYIQKPVRIFI